MTAWDAIIVGAGPAGAATALHLARSGARVLLLDRARFPRDKACSEYLSPETTRLLERLGEGVLEAVERAAPARLYGMKVVAPNGAAMQGTFAARHGFAAPRPYSFALPRTAFDAILVKAAASAGAVVREGVAVLDLVLEHGAVVGVVAKTGSGKREALRARIVVGADGLNSVVARRLGLARRAGPRRIAFSAHVADVAGVADVGELHVSGCGYVGLGPIGGGVTTVALVLPLAAVRRAGRTRDVRASFFDELERFPGLRGRFDPRRLVRPVLAALAGALARPHPLTGPVLAPYRAARRAAFAGKWVLERLIGLGVGWPALTDRVVSRLARRPDLADLLVGATGNFVPARRVLAPRLLTQFVW